MADNTELNPGAGGNIISDEDIGGVHRSRVKIILGAFGVDGGDVDISNPLPITGAGVAGVPVLSVLTVQGIAGGFPIPVMGPAGFGGAFPPDGFAGGWNDGAGAMESARVYDLDTGVGTEWAVGVNLRFGAGGGSVEAGTVTAPLVTREKQSGTSATSNVAQNAANVTLVAANANRIQAMIYNDALAVLFVKLGATASTTSYTVQLAAGGFMSINSYTGIIDGIWAAAGVGAARVTELT